MRALCLVLLIFGGILLAASAEDVITTQTREFRGQVLSADPTGIRIALSGGGETIIPRSLIIGKPRIAAPASILSGIKAYEQGKLKEAQLNLSKAAMQYQGLDLDWAMQAIMYYGRSCFANGEYEKAAKIFSAFLEAYADEPMAIGAQIGQAEIEISKGNYAAAAAKLRELAIEFDKQLKPNKDQIAYAAEIYLNLGQALENQTNDIEALAAYLKVTALYPADAYYSEALYRAARLYRKLDQPQKAEMLYAELIEDHAGSELATKAKREKASLPRQPDAAPSAQP